MASSFSVRDLITPELRAILGKVQNRKPILEAMGVQLVSLTKRAFSDSALRPTAWAPRKKPAPHQLLRKSGAMWHSIRISAVTADLVTVTSDRKYAAAQQLGSKRGLPPRPFFPFTKDGKMTQVAQDKVRKVALAKLASLLKS